ncbi:RibD family protein [Streptomyces sp. LZ34]
MNISEWVGADEWTTVEGRPYVVYKYAATLDGRIAAADSTSQWITSVESRAEVHSLRAACQATVVGSGTQQADNPHLAVRSAVDDPKLKVVVPVHAATFDRLVDAADEVLVMPYATANREAYEAANAVLLERADRLVAVWNGQPPTGKGGGTADVVYEAREAGLPVDVVWPDGASRQA